MLLTFTNVTAVDVYVGSMYKQINAGASLQTRRNFADLDHDYTLKALLEAGTLQITDITIEVGDSFGLLASPSLSFTNITRPLPADLPVLSTIWNSDDNAMNWTDGTNWRDAQGVIT